METHKGFRLPSSLAARLQDAAKKSLQSEGAIIRAALSEFLAKRKTAAAIFGAVEQSEKETSK